MTSLVRLWITTALIVAVLLLGYIVLPLTGENRPWGVVIGLLLVAGTIPVLVRRVRSVLDSSEPFQEALAALAVVSALVVVGPAAVYYSIGASTDEFNGLVTKIDAVYFTMSIVSTIGFGDIHPVGQAARLITTLHIVFTLVIAGGALRLITWAAKRRIAESGLTPGRR
jgi:voltage-gated potassium channel